MNSSEHHKAMRDRVKELIFIPNDSDKGDKGVNSKKHPKYIRGGYDYNPVL